MSRRTSRLQRSPNTSMVALIGHPDRGSYASLILLAIYYHQVLPSRQAVANHKRKEPRAEAGRGGCADPPERVLPEQRRCRARPGRRVAHRPRGARLRNGLPRERPVRFGPDRCGRLLDASSLGSPAVARQARRGAPLRHGALRGHCPRSAVGPALEGPHRRDDTAGHRPAGTAGPARPHYRPARRNYADSLGWPSSPDYRASGACPGPAALLIEERGVLVAGDMLSDVLIPMLDLNDAADPIEDYLAALRLLEDAAGDVDVLIPGHGSIGEADQVRARIDQDRAYVHALRDAGVPGDPRVGPSATFGKDWLPGVHERQLQQLARRTERDGTPG